MTEWKRNKWTIRITNEQMAQHAAVWGGPEWSRKVHSASVIAPTEEEWERYREAVRHLEAAREYEGFDEGCNCEHAFIEEPTDCIEREYAETHDEWIERVNAKAEVDGWPEPKLPYVDFAGLGLS